MAPATVLISGAGVAGPMLAYWLARRGLKPTIIERAPALRATGQSLEVEGPCLEIIRKMGLEEVIIQKRTKEAGLAFVDKRNRPYAELPVNDAVTFTYAYEVLRGDLVRIFYDASNPGQDTAYIFGDYIVDVENGSEKVTVKFASGRPPRDFDVLVIADGMNSKTRGLVFKDLETATPIHPLGLYCAFFSIPWDKRDGTWSRFYNTGGRQILLRPHGPTGTAAYLCVSRAYCKGFGQLDDKGKKDLVHRLFANVGWEAPRILQGMDQADDFYMTEIAQVKIDKWHHGRVVLLGDAAFCPSPISGGGATTSVTAAYVLAAELVGHDTVDGAFTAYEAKIRPWIETNQKLPPGIVSFMCPRSKAGVGVFRVVMKVLLSRAMLPVLTQLPKLWGHDGEEFKVPEYAL